ncbi:2-hydroxy-6-ketonona-2,4-dienedioic acid hydrolase [Klebsiella pneumoniae]|uniref:2-hydroxy-6-ketonona-2,4-dienedioic acid hydrolase n=1 Tax=Klebsiella pneumoniae TaxID=573 RepID=A0A378A4M9_KLEPN|nr:2-hydroxy-6-ketonona-2,4-dienedioic acid hydrolase [Klebsiella pneumoniae]
MMSIFVFDTRDLTEALFEARLNNMLSRRDHLEQLRQEAWKPTRSSFLTLARGWAKSARQL